MKKLASMGLFVFLLISLCGCKSEDYKQAAELMRDGKYEEAATAYRSLEDYKDSEERAIMLEVKSLMGRYQDFYDEMGSLGLGNYDIELAPLVKIISDFGQLDMEKIAKYPELDKYVQGVSGINEGILKIIDVDHEAIEKFFGPGFAGLGAGPCSQYWQDSAGISTSRHILFSNFLCVPAALP